MIVFGPFLFISLFVTHVVRKKWNSWGLQLFLNFIFPFCKINFNCGHGNINNEWRLVLIFFCTFNEMLSILISVKKKMMSGGFPFAHSSEITSFTSIHGHFECWCSEIVRKANKKLIQKFHFFLYEMCFFSCIIQQYKTDFDSFFNS